ncbi:MAG: hypothetical protein R3D52_10185 [Xanthobacteraceae bacterium]
MFGSDAVTVCGLDFYPHDRIVFASDCPFDPEKGTGYIRETLRILNLRSTLPRRTASASVFAISRRLRAKSSSCDGILIRAA